MITDRPQPDIWVLGAMLAATMASASIFQFVIAALSPSIVADLGLSRLELGAISACYYVAAAGASFVLGRAMDGLSGATSTLLLYGLSSSAFGLAAALPTGWGFMAAAGLGGVAAGLSNPVTNRLIVAQPRAHGILVGVKQSGVQLAALAAGVAMPLLALSAGWRNALAMFAIGLVLAGAAAWLVAPPALTEPVVIRSRVERLPRPVHWLCAYAFLMGTGMSAVTIHVVLYGEEEAGLSVPHAGLLLATMGLAGAIGRIFSSIVAARGDMLGQWMAVAACIAVVGVIVIAATTSPALIFVGAVTVGLSGASWNGLAVLAILRVCSKRQTGHATGVMLAGFFLGLAAAPPVFGAVVDESGSYPMAWSVTASCFASAAAVALALTRRYSLFHSSVPVSDG